MKFFFAIFLSFYEWQFKQYLISMVFNQFKIEVQFFLTASSFPNFDGPNAFLPKFNRPLALTSERLGCYHQLLYVAFFSICEMKVFS